MKYVREQKKSGDVVFHEAPDGYRKKLSGGQPARKKS